MTVLLECLQIFAGGKQVTSKDEIQAIQWDTWTCVLGPETAGTWPKYSQTNDINATSASFQHQTIVTGDDFGLVKLFRFPSLRKGMYIRLPWLQESFHVVNASAKRKNQIFRLFFENCDV